MKQPDPLPATGTLTPQEQAAAEWVLRNGRGLMPAEKAEFAQWIGQNPRNGSVYAEMAETSRLLDGMLGVAPAGTTPFPAPLAASAPAPRSRTLGRVAGSLAAAAALALVTTLAWRHFAPGAATFSAASVAEFGATRQVKLPDGSTVQLNSDSGVEVSFSGRERRVRLTKGEAYFSVAKDPLRPFWVDTGALSVRAVGTAFNVRIRSDEVSVLVAEGKVRVVAGRERAAAPAASLDQMGSPVAAGQLAELATAPDRAAAPPVIVTAVEPRAMKSALAWQQGRLEFFETPLSEVVAQFNRYNRHQIVIVDSALASRRFGGAFDAHQVEPLLELLQQSFGVVTEERGGVTEIRSAR